VVVVRWGKGWFAIVLGIVVAVMMVAYVAVPARLAGVKSERSRRDKLTATAIGGAIGALVCSPPYTLGRIAILMLGSHRLRVLAVLLLAVAVVLQTGATTATKAVKFSAKLVTGHSLALDESDTGALGHRHLTPDSQYRSPDASSNGINRGDLSPTRTRPLGTCGSETFGQLPLPSSDSEDR
jgi:hypothetical protein